jgi:iron complex transport system ATP-binding protein
MSPSAIHARGVRVRLGGRWVVDGIDFDANPGEITAIVGPNGSGKTTLLRALAGLIDSAGEIKHGADDLRALRPKERAQRVTYLPQTSSLNAMLSVRQVVALARYASHPGLFSKTRSDDVMIERALSRVDIASIADSIYPELSGGQKRLVLLARALASGASTLLLDEPTASLDVKHALSLFALLTGLSREGYCIVVVLHDLDDVRRYAERAVLLEAGKVRAAGQPSSADFAASAERIYGVTLVDKDRLGFRLHGDSGNAA